MRPWAMVCGFVLLLAGAVTTATGETAPDFSLPDLHGRMHTLSAHRGKKALLIVYASW